MNCEEVLERARGLARKIEVELAADIHYYLKQRARAKMITKLLKRVFASCLALWRLGFEMMTPAMVAEVARRSELSEQSVRYSLNKLGAFRVLTAVRGGNMKKYRYMLSVEASEYWREKLRGEELG